MPNSEFKIIFFGDSICVGQGVSIHRGWVTQLAQAIEEWMSIHHIQVLIENASANGRTTRQALEAMPYEVQSHGVDLIIVQFGMNDCNRWVTDRGLPRVSEMAFVANLVEIAHRAITFGARYLIYNTNHPTLRTSTFLPYSNISYQEANQHYNSLIRKAVAITKESSFMKDRIQVYLNDIEKKFQSKIKGNPALLKKFLLEDGLHLSEKGHNFYFRNIWPLLKQILEKEFL